MTANIKAEYISFDDKSHIILLIIREESNCSYKKVDKYNFDLEYL